LSLVLDEVCRVELDWDSVCAVLDQVTLLSPDTDGFGGLFTFGNSFLLFPLLGDGFGKDIAVAVAVAILKGELFSEELVVSQLVVKKLHERLVVILDASIVLLVEDRESVEMFDFLVVQL
jgi:hypothetical protein